MIASIEGIGCLAGIAPWKRKRLVAAFANRNGPPLARSAAQAVRLAKANGGAIACWESRKPNGLDNLAQAAGVPVWSIEDGFIRSAGLGAALVQPCSLALDSQGPHYDGARPSDLEVLLQTSAFPPDDLARAMALIGRIRTGGITKYNLAGAAPELPTDRRVVVVLGQVDGDLSVLRGGGGVTVAAMLDQARAASPDAFLVYKPHPDVVSGLREGVATAPGADLTAPDADLAALLARADEVHVLTSLGGFEALLRGCRVVVHGQPFFAGWGLTQDLNPVARRTRRLSLAELVAGVLIAYPVYFHPGLGRRCSVEELLDWLETEGRAALPSAPWRWVASAARRLGQSLRK